MLQVYNGWKLSFVRGLVFLHLFLFMVWIFRYQPEWMHWKCNLKLMRNTSARVVVCAHNVATDELCFCFIFFFSFKCISVAPLHVLFFLCACSRGCVAAHCSREQVHDLWTCGGPCWRKFFGKKFLQAYKNRVFIFYMLCKSHCHAWSCGLNVFLACSLWTSVHTRYISVFCSCHTVIVFFAFVSGQLWWKNKTADAKGSAGHAGREPSFDTAMHLGIELYIALPHQGCIWPLVYCSAVL